jgi:GNAT superfamily N-acetyltransferase
MNPEKAFIALLMLSQSCRGKGIGAGVVSALERDLSRRGIRSIGAGVMVNNAPAIAFWDKMGYRIVGGPELLPDRTTVFGLLKDINEPDSMGKEPMLQK